MNQTELLKALEDELPYWTWVPYPPINGSAPIVGACDGRVVVVAKTSCLEFKYKAIETGEPPTLIKRSSFADWACREVVAHD